MRKNEELSKVIFESNMEIKLSENWIIKSDSLNYILSRKSGKRFIVDGYYSSLEELIDALLEKKIRESEATTLRALKRELVKARNEIKVICDKINENVKNN